MKILRTIGASVLGVAVLVTLAAVFFGATKAEPEPNSGPALHITTHTGEEIVGYFDDGSSRVEFESRMETSLYVSVQVRVNDLVLDVSVELGEGGEKKAGVMDGYGKALSREDKEVLIALTNLLEHYLDPFRQQVSPHEDLLVRTVGLWSEAPVGFPLIRQELLPPQNP